MTKEWRGLIGAVVGGGLVVGLAVFCMPLLPTIIDKCTMNDWMREKEIEMRRKYPDLYENQCNETTNN